MAEDVTESLVSLLQEARQSAASPKAEADFTAVLDRLQGPLRLAIAGKVKSGKSTLLNALIGEPLAPTDARECTKIVTWYRLSHRPYAKLYPIRWPTDRAPLPPHRRPARGRSWRAERRACRPPRDRMADREAAAPHDR